jgi:AGZA family xanthine/uracil permease-like MFS transporter
VFWSGVVNLALSLLNIRVSILRGIPRGIRLGISAGIGLFIVLIGLINSTWVTSHPATVLGHGELTALHVTFLLGLIITAVMMVRGVPGAFILGAIVTTLAAWPIGRWWGDAAASNHGVSTLVNFNGVVAWPDFSLLLQADIMGALRWELLPVIFAMAFTDLFDSLSTFIGVAEAGKLVGPDGEPLHVKRSLLVDSLASVISGPLGSSAGTSYIESVAGVKAGGRSGLTAVVAGLLFLPFLFLSPLLSLVPSLATAPVLVLVGLLMLQSLAGIDWEHLEEAIPAFVACVWVPFSFSITQGLVWGFLTWTAIKVLTGKGREVSPVLWGINAVCILSLVTF